MFSLTSNHFDLSSLHYITPRDDMPAFAPLDDHAYTLHNYVIAVLSENIPEIPLGKPELFYLALVARLALVKPANRSIKRGRIYGSV